MITHLFSVRAIPVFVSAAVLASILVGCETPRADRIRVTRTSNGSIADGATPPLDGTGGFTTGAAICDPSNSGPHQWPMNVSTKGNFYPDPSSTPSATVSVDSKYGRTVTITVKGAMTPYPTPAQ